MCNTVLTIFIVTYNRAKLLEQSMKSILNQTYTDFFLIVLDNNSSDHTMQIVRKFEDKRVTYVRHETNIGAIGNGNFAITTCKTKYFVIFHDDDLMYPNMIEEEISYFVEYRDVAIVSCRAQTINDSGEITYSNGFDFPTLPVCNFYSKKQYLSQFLGGKGGIICPSVMYRTEFIHDKKLLFSTEVGPANDQLMWFNIEKNDGEIVLLNKKLMYYRLHDSQDSNVNSSTMLIDLYRFLCNDSYYKEVLKGKSRYTNKRFYYISVLLGIRFINKEISLGDYNKNQHYIKNDICKGIVIKTKLGIIEFMCKRIPIIFNFILALKRRIKNHKNRKE